MQCNLNSFGPFSRIAAYVSLIHTISRIYPYHATFLPPTSTFPFVRGSPMHTSATNTMSLPRCAWIRASVESASPDACTYVCAVVWKGRASDVWGVVGGERVGECGVVCTHGQNVSPILHHTTSHQHATTCSVAPYEVTFSQHDTTRTHTHRRMRHTHTHIWTHQWTHQSRGVWRLLRLCYRVWCVASYVARKQRLYSDVVEVCVR